MNSRLSEMQRVFWEAISYPTGVASYLSQANPETVDLFHRTFSETPEFSRVERVQVYAEAYFFRLLDVLAEMFPMLLWQLGQDRFHNLVTDYLLVHPSRNPNLRHLGDALPDYLATHPLHSTKPQLSDLCRIELALNRALDAPDSALLTRQALASVAPSAWPRLRFTFCASLQLLDAGWDFQAFREAQRAAAPVPRLPKADEPYAVCVWRKEYTVYTRQLSAAEAVLLRSLRAGKSFNDAAADAARLGADAQHLVTCLNRWLDDEVLSALSVD